MLENLNLIVMERDFGTRGSARGHVKRSYGRVETYDDCEGRHQFGLGE